MVIVARRQVSAVQKHTLHSVRRAKQHSANHAVTGKGEDVSSYVFQALTRQAASSTTYTAGNPPAGQAVRKKNGTGAAQAKHQTGIEHGPSTPGTNPEGDDGDSSACSSPRSRDAAVHADDVSNRQRGAWVFPAEALRGCQPSRPLLQQRDPWHSRN
ncbi:uncharacterized protein UV8b_05931 [Ustilaginoidea virens]|uniref:Uncharacterized protein n=1 Tax=Ustilaginoidea virens TaxID=1159556 RepID=A0A8E5HUC7_USTVR|nr:uncharacterized protein UV8b_05931 [Ustilaginoidea virens]QUC21688.1 hypothetical protein UV8b_05931 [Ustilaginoidea virens]